MYLWKNAFLNLIRGKGRTILIGVIITTITVCTCIALSIHKASSSLVNRYIAKNPLEVSFRLERNNSRSSDDEEKTIQKISIEDVLNYGESQYVKDYYYLLEANMAAVNLTAVSETAKEKDAFSPKENLSFGDFRMTSYSNFAYLEDFVSGTKQIVEGNMIKTVDDVQEIVISKDLQVANNLSLGDEISFYFPDHQDTTYTFKIIGIYEDNSNNDTTNFMNIKALDTRNQVYTNLDTLQKLRKEQESDDSLEKGILNTGVTAKFYLLDRNYLEAFEKEVREKGLTAQYLLETNEEQVLTTLKPIQNIGTFSFQFLLVILIIGSIILTVIHFLNIRDRKYEIGVLRAIGMSKWQVTSQLVIEIFMIAMASFVIGTLGGTLLAQPVTNHILQNEITSYQQESTALQEHFGAQGFERPGMSEEKGRPGQQGATTAVNYIDSLDVQIDIVTIIEVFGIGIVLTVLSGIIASTFINQYDPNRILQDRG